MCYHETLIENYEMQCESEWNSIIYEYIVDFPAFAAIPAVCDKYVCMEARAFGCACAKIMPFNSNAKINCHSYEHSFVYIFHLFPSLKGPQDPLTTFQSLFTYITILFFAQLCIRNHNSKSIQHSTVDMRESTLPRSQGMFRVDCFKMNETSNKISIIVQTNSFVRTFHINIIHDCGRCSSLYAQYYARSQLRAKLKQKLHK